MPKRGTYEKCCIPKGAINDLNNDGAFKFIPTETVNRCVRRERMLGQISVRS